MCDTTRHTGALVYVQAKATHKEIVLDVRVKKMYYKQLHDSIVVTVIIIAVVAAFCFMLSIKNSIRILNKSYKSVRSSNIFDWTKVFTVSNGKLLENYILLIL